MYQEEQEDEWANFEQTQDINYEVSPLMEYEDLMNRTKNLISINQISSQRLKHHRIIITHNSHVSNIFNIYGKDSCITIKKKHHFGTHSVYDVVLANFRLQIYVLNLHRSSDEGDSALAETQIGVGGFGSVRKVKIGKNIFAIKRINFLAKAEGITGFDIQTQKAECIQIKKAIREYCLYKICSMLRIGPEVIFKYNYDLICFNNCIEFTMQLCEIPSKNVNFLSQRSISLENLRTDLLQNLKILHSLHIIHKDIKPQNILYSQSLSRFVFTDFGLAHAVEENIAEKSFCHFGGTIQYCSQQMKQLLSSKAGGRVNLYLNDFECLKNTIEKFKVETSKSSSISRNPMSYNSFLCSYQGIQSNSNSCEQWFQSELSSSSFKSSENIYIRSTNSLDAPLKNTSQINYFQSIILFFIFKSHEQHLDRLTSLKVKQIITSYSGEIDDEYVLGEVKRYILYTFYPSQNQTSLILKIVDLKNTARAYGIKDEETLKKIDQILAQKQAYVHQQIVNYFKLVKKSILDDSQSIEMQKFSKQMAVHLCLKNYNYFIGCSIRIMREGVKYIEKFKEVKAQKDWDLVLVCRLFIVCHNLNVMTIQESKLITNLFISLWEKSDICEILQQMSQENSQSNYNNQQRHPAANRNISKLIRHAVNYIIIKSENRASFDILQAFSYYLYRFSSTISEDYIFYYNHIKKIQILQDEPLPKRCSLKLQLVKYYRKICKIISSKPQRDEIVRKAQKIVSQLKLIEDKKYYFSCLTQLTWIYVQQKEEAGPLLAFKTLQQLKLYDCTEIQKYHVLIQVYRAIGSSYIQGNELDFSLEYFLKAKQYIIQYYGLQNLSLIYYECLNNISFIYYKQNKLQQSLESYKRILLYLETSKKIFGYEKSLVYRSIIAITLEMGIRKQEYPQIYILIKDIVRQTIFALISLTTSENQLRKYILDVSIFNFIHTPQKIEDKVFVMKSVLKCIENHLNYFIIPYEKINYTLNQIYVKELKKPSKGMVFIWNYIRIKIRHFRNVTREDFKLMNNFINHLIKGNSARRALIIIRKYIFHIPLDFYEERKAAFKLFHKILFNLGHPLQKMVLQLTLSDCSALYSRQYAEIYVSQENSNWRFKNGLLQKWLARV